MSWCGLVLLGRGFLLRGVVGQQAADVGLEFDRAIGLISGAPRDAYYLPGDIFRRKNEVYASAFYRTFRHIRLLGRIELLRDGNAADVFYAAQRRCSIAVEAGDDHGDDLAVPIFGQ